MNKMMLHHCEQFPDSFEEAWWEEERIPVSQITLPHGHHFSHGERHDGHVPDAPFEEWVVEMQELGRREEFLRNGRRPVGMWDRDLVRFNCAGPVGVRDHVEGIQSMEVHPHPEPEQVRASECVGIENVTGLERRVMYCHRGIDMSATGVGNTLAHAFGDLWLHQNSKSGVSRKICGGGKRIEAHLLSQSGLENTQRGRWDGCVGQLEADGPVEGPTQADMSLPLTDAFGHLLLEHDLKAKREGGDLRMSVEAATNGSNNAGSAVAGRVVAEAALRRCACQFLSFLFFLISNILDLF